MPDKFRLVMLGRLGVGKSGKIVNVTYWLRFLGNGNIVNTSSVVVLSGT